jgi:hypothetical protein
MNALANRAKIVRRRPTTMIILRAAMVVSLITVAVIIVAVIIVLPLLRAAVVVIVALIGAGVQQRRGTEHQYTQAGYQTFRHFHQIFPHCTYSKKGFRTQS